MVAPNTIDFAYVFANFDFSKNPTLFATEIAIFTIYVLMMVWAHFMDKKDVEKVRYFSAIKFYLYVLIIRIISRSMEHLSIDTNTDAS